MAQVKVCSLSKIIKKVTVLDNIDFTFEGGLIYGLRGINGSGKTMLMRCITGLIYPTSGEIYIDDKKLGKDVSFPPSIGALIENPKFLKEYTGFENLKMLADIQGKISSEEIRETLKSVGLSPDDKRTFYKYSLGMRQRLGIAAAILGKPEIILLDEPTNAIDADGLKGIRKVIRNLISPDRVIIVACHEKQEMDMLADVIIEMEDGKITGVEENEAFKNAEI